MSFDLLPLRRRGEALIIGSSPHRLSGQTKFYSHHVTIM